MKMEAGVATSLHFPRRPPVPVKAWGLSSEGSGRSLSAPVGPLGSERNLAVQLGSLTGLPPKPCDLAGLPVGPLSKHRCLASTLRGSGPRAGSAGQLKKVGSACASRFFLNSPFQRFGERSSLRMTATAAVVETARTTPLPEGRSSAAKFLPDRVSRVAPSGIFRIPAVDNGNPVDNFGAARSRSEPPGADGAESVDRFADA